MAAAGGAGPAHWKAARTAPVGTLPQPLSDARRQGLRRAGRTLLRSHRPNSPAPCPPRAATDTRWIHIADQDDQQAGKAVASHEGERKVRIAPKMLVTEAT
ncbi:hypothetical protein GCM10010430_74060 [Kitasatospora cystarginea]|uniref:Uncharacterized protein n=1 Tax=Kitasatospora cystarginea TaxID=58350 RepID=A0ABN3EZ79_9ACTN